MTLSAIRALLAHPRPHDAATQAALGVVELRTARQIRSDRYFNVTRAHAAPDASPPEHASRPGSARMG